MWGDEKRDRLAYTHKPGGYVTAVSAGSSHTCVITMDAGLKCWGNNYIGQLGIGSTANQYNPQTVSLGSGGSLGPGAAVGHNPKFKKLTKSVFKGINVLILSLSFFVVNIYYTSSQRI